MSAPDNSVKFLNTRELAARWNMSHRTLETWRWRKYGPPWIQLSKRNIKYRLADVIAWETGQSTAYRAQS